jgi:hypothetical protein
MKKQIEKGIKFLMILFIFIFSITGYFFITIINHEYSHFRDYRHLREDYFIEDEICILNMPTDITFKKLLPEAVGYYRFSYENNEYVTGEIERIQRYTEWKATAFDVLITLLYVASFITFLNIVLKGGNENE